MGVPADVTLQHAEASRAGDAAGGVDPAQAVVGEALQLQLAGPNLPLGGPVAVPVDLEDARVRVAQVEASGRGLWAQVQPQFALDSGSGQVQVGELGGRE